jgi:hypothetical protein
VDKGVRIRGATGNPNDVVIRNHGWEVSLRVMFLNHTDAWLEGVTLQGGWGDGGYNGLNLRIGANGGTASNCVIRSGSATGNSTGVAWLEGVGALLTHCVVTNNIMERNNFNHGLVLVDNGRVENCLVADNRYVIVDNVSDPVAGNNTSVMELRGGVVRNCTFAGNTVCEASVDGRGVIYNPGDWGVVSNCVVAANFPGPMDDDPGRVCSGDNYVVGRLFASTTDDATLTGSNGCNFGIPTHIFKNPSGGDYHLAPGSPAQDQGPRVGSPQEAAALGIPSVDLDGKPRVMGGKIDNGCYEASPRGTLLLVR